MTIQTSARPAVVLITGGTRGIGAACAELAAACGDRVIAWGRQAAERPVPDVVYEEVDVRDPEAVASAAASHDSIDLLVNAAGITGFAPAAELTASQWTEVVDTNLNGTFLVAHALFPALRRARGSVVNIGSITAHAPGTKRAAYCSSKAAVLMLTKILALEWAEHGVRVNAVSPGYTRTDMVQNAIESGHLDLERILHRIPQGRLAEPEEIARVVLALGVPSFQHVTGQEIIVDGGWTVNGAY